MFCIQIHQFDFKLRLAFLVRRFEQECDRVAFILALHLHRVIVAGAFQDFRHAEMQKNLRLRTKTKEV